MHKLIRVFLLPAIALSIAMPAVGQEEEQVIKTAKEGQAIDTVEDSTRSCITLRSLRRTQVIDDSNIVFRLRGRTTYHNILPRACTGLAREDRFSYDSGFGRLCEGDMIRVLYSGAFGSAGMREGAGCRLGMFQKISQEDAKALKDAPLNQPESKIKLPMPAPQEVGADTEESEDSDPE